MSETVTTPTKDCWGPVLWRAIHELAAGYPDAPSPARQSATRLLFSALAGALPCDDCGAHFADLVPMIDVRSRDALLRSTVDVHNAVNRRLGKPELTYAQAVAEMNRTNTRCQLGGGVTTPAAPTSATTAPNTASIVLFAVGAAALLAGVVMIAVGASQSRQRARASRSLA